MRLFDETAPDANLLPTQLDLIQKASLGNGGYKRALEQVINNLQEINPTASELLSLGPIY